MIRLIAINLAAFLFSGVAYAEQADLWKALRDQSHFAIIRHAAAPGIGDPENFVLGDCSTQRNLSEEGRAQAKRIGKAFKKHGMGDALVFTSMWCRCRETAKLMSLGRALPFNALNSFFKFPEKKSEQMAKLKNFIRSKTPLVETLIMVTHQVVITELLDVFPKSGEIIVARWNLENRKFEVLGSMVIE